MTAPIDLQVLTAMPKAALGGQGLFSTTGAVHAAASFTPSGEVLIIPAALAVQTARRAGLMLAGFVRDEGLNVYAPERMPL